MVEPLALIMTAIAAFTLGYTLGSRTSLATVREIATLREQARLLLEQVSNLRIDVGVLKKVSKLS